MKKIIYLLLLFTSVAFSQVNSDLVRVIHGEPLGSNPLTTITSVQVLSTTETSIQLRWDVSSPSTGQLLYSMDTSYSSSTTEETNLLSFHIQTISGLTANTTYNIKIIGFDRDSSDPQAVPIEEYTLQVTTLEAAGSEPTVTVSANDATATEAGPTTGQVTFTSSEAAGSGGLTINYTWYGTATITTDYTGPTGSVTIAEGSTSATVTVTPVDDGTAEFTETVVFEIEPTAGYIVGSPSIATISIIDDDGATGTLVADVVATDKNAYEEGLDTATFTFSLSEVNNTGSTINISYEIIDTATSASDYTALTGTAAIPDGSQSVDVVLTPLQDTTIEPLETVAVKVLDGAGYINRGSPFAVAYIHDNDDTNFPAVSGQSSATTLAHLTGSTFTGQYVTIDAVIDATGATFDSGIVLRAGTGYITGTNINLNGAGIEDGTGDIFAPTVTFSSVYTLSRLRPEVFGAVANDATADDSAITAMINNVEHGHGTPNGVYIKNAETVHTRSGTFDWDMNGCIVRTTNGSALSHGTATSNQTTYMFRFENDNINLYNGEFDGQDIASRCIYFYGNATNSLINLWIHNYYAPPNAYARGTAVKWEIQAPYTYGELHDNVIENIGAASDGSANNAPYGIAKGISYTITVNNLSNTYHSGNRIENIYGDDAEGFINNRSGSYNYGTNQTNMFFDNDQFIACQRRGVKVNASNAHFNRCVFRSATNAPIFSGAQAALVNVFSISSGQEIKNVRFYNNLIDIVGDSDNAALAVTDATDCIFEYNTMSAAYVSSTSSIGFAANSTQNGLYDGYLDDTVIFRYNTMNNLRINLGVVHNPVNGGAIISNNTQNLVLDRTVGLYWAAIRCVSSSGQTSGYTFTDHVINVDIQSTTGLSLFGGVFNTQGSEPKNLTFDNVDINYTSAIAPTYAWAYTGKNDTSANFDSTNTIIDCDITGNALNGVVGTGAVFVKGAVQNVVITNSFDDASPTPNAITVQ